MIQYSLIATILWFFSSFFLLGCSNSNKTNVTKNNIKVVDLTDAYIIERRTAANRINNNATLKQFLNKEKFYKPCKIFLKESQSIQPPTPKTILECFETAPGTATPYLVEKVLQLQPAIPKTTLTKILKSIAYTNAQHTSSIKRLIKAGATTEMINLDYVRSGNTRGCDSLEVIIKNNKILYQNSLLSKSTRFQKEALHNLAVSGMEINLCTKAIRLLIHYNPALLDYQSGYYQTPLVAYLLDPAWDQWDLQTAKLLMTKKNLNYQGKHGNTALFALGSHSGTRKTRFDQAIINAALAKGADLNIKNKQGLSYAGYILTERPDLLDFVQGGKKLASCFKLTYKKLDSMLSVKEKQTLKKVNFYLTPHLTWLENRVVKQLPLPSKDDCLKQYFAFISVDKPNVMASKIIRAYAKEMKQ